jgi:DNA polymerase-3 subunit beta
MNITKALTITGKIVAKRATIPMLAGVRVTITDGVAALQATDIDQYITVYCDAPDAADLAPTIVEHKTLAALVKGAPSVDIGTLVRGMAPICDAGDWLPEHEYTVDGTMTLAAPAWRDTLASVGSCMSGEETCYYLSGIHFGAAHGHAVSTDGHRMAALRLPDGALDLTEDIIVPHHAVLMLASILAKDTETRTITVNTTPRNGTWTRIMTSTVDYAARVIDGTFPDWQRIMPAKAPKHTLTLRVATLAGHGAAMARLVPRDNGRALVETTSVSTSPDMGASTTLSLPVMDAASSGWKPVAFQPKYLAALADAFPKGATITLAMVDTTSPALITSVDAPDMRYVLMPIRA